MGKQILYVLIQDLRDSYRKMKDAEAVKCTCTGFVIQYQGCSCEKSKAVKKAKEDFWCSVKGIVNNG